MYHAPYPTPSYLHLERIVTDHVIPVNLVELNVDLSIKSRWKRTQYLSHGECTLQRHVGDSSSEILVMSDCRRLLGRVRNIRIRDAWGGRVMVGELHLVRNSPTTERFIRRVGSGLTNLVLNPDGQLVRKRVWSMKTLFKPHYTVHYKTLHCYHIDLR